MPTYEEIVTDYCLTHKNGAARELRWFSMQKTLPHAIRCAAYAEGPSGKRLHHQRRIPRRVLAKAHRKLRTNIHRIKTTRSFHELFSLVDSLTRKIRGIGELYVYDTSLRIGAKLELRPDDVYIHAGVRMGLKNCGIDTNCERISKKKLPKAFQILDAHEIEDVLCIYKNQLAGASLRQRRGPSCFS